MKNPAPRILVVDDETDITEILTEILEGSDYDVTTCHNGADAIRLFHENPFDLVITDVAMPEKNGIEMVRELSAVYPDFKAIVMSGYGQQLQELKLEKNAGLGIVCTFAKPLDLMELLSTTNLILSGQ